MYSEKGSNSNREHLYTMRKTFTHQSHSPECAEMKSSNSLKHIKY